MDKKLQLTFFQLLLVFMIIEGFLWALMAIISTNNDFVLELMLIFIVIGSIVVIIDGFVKLMMDKELIYAALLQDMNETDLVIEALTNITVLFIVKSYYILDSNGTYDLIFNVVVLINVLVLIALGINIVKELPMQYSLNEQEFRVKAKRYFIIMGYISPLMILGTIMIASQLAIIGINTGTMAFFYVLMGFIAGYTLLLITTQKTLEIVFLESSEKEETKKLLKELYNDPEKLEAYLNTRVKLAVVPNLLLGIIVLPIVVYTILVL